jgi:hypothetical protein
MLLLCKRRAMARSTNAADVVIATRALDRKCSVFNHVQTTDDDNGGSLEQRMRSCASETRAPRWIFACDEVQKLSSNHLARALCAIALKRMVQGRSLDLRA